ncbi:ATP-binding protein [Actinoplanes sp. NPDC048988]|uniref:ATP-binding protein n=1 Tax=Actinoplanes sp. NPDC048988 TaxID=3363901 RepID=UPI0037172A2C
MQTISPTAPHGADAVALAPLTEWLNLSLGRCLLRRIGPGVPAGVPGWSVAPSEALHLLGFGAGGAGTEAAGVRQRLSAADEALAESRTTLPRPLARLAEQFSLTGLELRLLCLVLAPELDGRYGLAVGVLQDDLTRRRPGLTLLAELMSHTEVSAWDLRRTVHAAGSVASAGLVRVAEPDAPPVDAGYAPTGSVVAHLVAASIEQAVAATGAVLCRPRPADEPPLSAAETELAGRLRRPAMLHLTGGDSGQGWFRRLASASGVPLVIGDLEQVDAGPARVAAAADWAVLSRLAGSGLLVLGLDGLGAVERRQVTEGLVRAARHLRLVATDAAWPGSGVLLRAPAVTVAQRAAWWSSAAARTGVALTDEDIRRLAATAPIEPEHMTRSLAAGGADVALVQQAARDVAPVALPPGVRRIVPAYGWDDIVLAESRKDLLRAIPLHVLHAGRVLQEWGFAGRMPYGQGVAALFSGPSGTGKTMAAQIVAGDLGVELLQVDLSKTVSKYIGETEKNLERTFEAAERSGAVLLFDEADAIFGKRTEIKDAHDRHANVEVAYLLQRMESFRGLAVLTTNVKQNIDDAFVRRLRFVVTFALPDAAERERIWRRAFPAGAPLAADATIAGLAARLQIPGGSIQNIALHAAFLAAAEGGRIEAGHVLTAARRELTKIGMLAAERGLADDELVAS